MSDLEDFVEICRDTGRMVDFVQGAGGNISVKSDDKMLIKASGLLLRDVTPERGHLYVDQKRITDFLETVPADVTWSESLEAAYLSAIRRSRINEETVMPSLETGFHSFLSRAVIHTHPLVVNAYACTNDGQEILREKFPEAIFVPYATIGAVLSKAVYTAGARPNDGKPIFLLNHGIINHSTEISYAALQMLEVEGTLGFDLASRGGKGTPEFTPLPEGGRSPAVQELIDRGLDEDLKYHAFPDSVVYCSGGYSIGNKRIGDGIIKLYDDGRIDASALKNPTAVAEIVHANAYIALSAQKLGGIKPLHWNEIETIKNMASEKYRQRMAERQ
jgi:ribulose-5-phosphate 4-epimerase/fuculose-1-phosphate aldolase